MSNYIIVSKNKHMRMPLTENDYQRLLIENVKIYFCLVKKYYNSTLCSLILTSKSVYKLYSLKKIKKKYFQHYL